MIGKLIAGLMALSLTSFCLSAAAQDSIPYLTGTVHLSIAKGTMDCDLTLSGYPFISDYLIRINSGMNILYFRSVQPDFKIYYDRSSTDSTSTDETNGYYFGADPKKGGKFLPKAIRFRYTGKFPVVTDTAMSGEVSVQDWRGNIAFNGYSIRADGLQSCWYPVLYDIKKKKRYERVRYDLDVDCPDCRVIYVNGTAPVSASRAHLHSDAPRELFVYAGDFPVVNSQGTFFLNAGLNEARLRSFTKTTNDVKHFYESHLGIPFTDTITYVQATPTAPDHAWAFVAFPSIVNVGFGKYALNSYADPQESGVMQSMSHELGHFYFGTSRYFNTPFSPVLGEGLTEFLSLNVSRALLPDSTYKKRIAQKIKAMKEFKPLPFTRIQTEKDFQNRELYVYYFAPLLHMAIQKEIGEKATWEWMQQLLKTPADFTDYGFLEATLGKALGNPGRLAELKAKYFDSDQALDNTLREIGN